MTDVAIAYTSAETTRDAADELAARINEDMPGEPADALILFASARYDHAELLRLLQAGCRPKLLVGSSSAGEFTQDVRGAGIACALALRSEDIVFSIGIGRNLSRDRERAARDIVGAFRGATVRTHPYRSALVMTDALAGHADDLVEQLTVATSGQYQFFGGGAGDDAQFQRTRVFYGTEALTDAAVALEMLSKKPLGIGVGHGWSPATAAMRVTESKDMDLISLNGLPAAEAFETHALATGQLFDRTAPMPFFLHNIIGIDTHDGYRLRVPLSIGADGSVRCASEIPTGVKVHIMQTDAASAVKAAGRATERALEALAGNPPRVALFFDCVATRLRMGESFGQELEALSNRIGAATSFLGCNTHGQIARAEGQFNGFHNCTAVVCLLPE